MAIKDEDGNEELEPIGSILRETLRQMALRSIRLTQERTRHMDDCFDDFDGPDWQDWMIIGPLSEDIAREKREQDRIQRDLDDEDEYWEIINKKW
jgi:hypothetical protein